MRKKTEGGGGGGGEGIGKDGEKGEVSLVLVLLKPLLQ